MRRISYSHHHITANHNWTFGVYSRCKILTTFSISFISVPKKKKAVEMNALLLGEINWFLLKKIIIELHEVIAWDEVDVQKNAVRCDMRWS